MQNIPVTRILVLTVAAGYAALCVCPADSAENDYEERLAKVARIVLHRNPGRLRDGQQYVKKHVPEHVGYDTFTRILRTELTKGKAPDASQKKYTITPADHLTDKQAKRYNSGLEQKYRYMLVRPADYDPAESYPLVVGLHGRMGDPDGDYFWMRWCVKKGKAKNRTIMIVSKGARSGRHNAAGVAAAVRKTLQETAAHPEAVLLMSYSNAGKSGIRILENEPDLFSGYYVYASHIPEHDLVEDMPVYFACGTKDSIFYDAMSQDVPDLADDHGDIVWDEIKGQGHSFESGYFANQVFPWFEKRTVPLGEFASTFSVDHATTFTEGCSFVRVMAKENASEFSVTGQVKNETQLQLDVKPESAVRDVRVYLPGAVFDLDRTLTIEMNGTAYEFNPGQPKAWLALETASYYRDADKICGHAWTWSQAREKRQ